MEAITDSKVTAAMKWLDTMPYNKKFPVTEWQAEVVRTWMRQQPEFDGGMNFNSTFTKIYKCEIIPAPKKWQDKKLTV